MNCSEMNYLDLFSGIGGFALAFQNAGFDFDNHYFSEVDKYATEIYERHFPDAIRCGDVRRIGNELEKVDIITGGFPCQSFSIAGGRRGFTDTRGTLFFEIERLAGIYKPAYMVLENVKGLLSHDRGNTIRVILERLTGLDYYVQLLLLNTKDFGIPQNRERLFFICSLGDKPRPEISDIRSRKTEVNEKRNGKDFSAGCIGTKNQSGQCNFDGGSTLISNAIDANYYKGIDNHGQRTCIAIDTKNSYGVPKVFNDSCPTITANHYKEQISIGTLRTHKDGEGFREMQSAVSPALNARARQDGSGQPVVMFTEKRTDEARQIRKENMKAGRDYSPRRGKQLMPREDNIGNCLTGSMTVEHILSDGISIRRLTPVECERLQGFPEIEKYGRIKVWLDHQNNYVNVGNKNHKLLKSVGNVEKIENRKNALFAGRNMSPKFQNNNKPVPLNVHIFCEENGVLIRNQQELLLNASGVEKKNWSHPFIKIDDFVQLLVGLNIMLEKITRHGEVALQQNEQFLIPQKNGNKPEKTFGSEIMLPVRDAENDSTTLRELLKSTTLDRLNTKVSEQNLKTLSLFVIRAIIGYIPKKIFSQHSFTIRIHTKVGYTYGLSDTQRYKTLGNAVTVKVVEEIAKTIKEVI